MTDHPDLVVLTVVAAIGCCALVFAEWKHRPKLRIASKICGSLAFVALGASAGMWIPRSYELPVNWLPFKNWMLYGLVLGMIGDFALLGSSNTAFLGGLAAFLLGHIAYIVGVAQLASIGDWLHAASFYALVPVIVGLTALGLLWRHLGTMRVPVIAYVVAIITMMIGAIAVGRGAAIPIGNRILLVVGAALFFASDLSVAREKFVARSFANQAWGLPAYYAGQVLIAWSLAAQT